MGNLPQEGTLTFILSPFAKRLALYSSSFWDFSLFQPRAAWDPVVLAGKSRSSVVHTHCSRFGTLEASVSPPF